MVINSEDVTAADAEVVKAAVLQLSWATGIRFKYTGGTDVIPYNRRKQFKGNTDLVIAWATNAEVPDFIRPGRSRPCAPRRGSSCRSRRPRHPCPGSPPSPGRAWPSTSLRGFFSHCTVGGQLVLHELGHALGLKHVPAYEQLMNGRTYYRSPDGYYKGVFNAGDLNGLKKVGKAQGCLSTLDREPGRRGVVAGGDRYISTSPPPRRSLVVEAEVVAPPGNPAMSCTSVPTPSWVWLKDIGVLRPGLRGRR